MARRVIWAEHSEPAGKAVHSHQPTDQGHDPLSLPHPWLLLWLPPPLSDIYLYDHTCWGVPGLATSGALV